MTIEKKGVFHWDTIISALKEADPYCGIEGFDGDEKFLHRMEVKPSSPDKAAALEAVLDAHDADTALAAWNARQDRIKKAPEDIRKIPGWGTWTAQEAADHIDANVNDLLSAKVAVKNMVKIICYLRDHAGIV